MQYFEPIVPKNDGISKYLNYVKLRYEWANKDDEAAVSKGERNGRFTDPG